MANHSAEKVTLKQLSEPEAYVTISDNELVKFWKDKYGFDIWDAVGKAAKDIATHPGMSKRDKLEALIKVAELTFRLKRANSNDRSGVGPSITIINNDPTASAKEVVDIPR